MRKSLLNKHENYAGLVAYRDALSSHATDLLRLGATPPPIGDATRSLLACGLTNCLPLLALGDDALVVLRARVGSASPVVAIADIASGESMQIAASIETLVPALFVNSLIDVPAGRWPSIGEDTHDSLSALVCMDWALGGSSRLVDYEAVLSDQGIRQAFSEGAEHEVRYAQMIRAISLVAPGDLRSAFQSILLNLNQASDPGDVAAFDLGAWSEPGQVVMAAAESQAGEPKGARAIAQVLCCSANQDIEWINGDGVSIFRKEAASPSQGSLAAAHKLKSACPVDRCLALVVSRMNKQGAAYDGRAHLKLLKILSDMQRYRTAWNFALTAGFWIYQRTGSVPLELTVLQGRIAREYLPHDVWPIVYNNLRAIGISASVLEA